MLALSGPHVTNAAIAHLGKLTTLQNLTLAQTAVTGEGLSGLEGLSQLTTLNLFGMKPGKVGLSRLPKLPALRHLDLQCVKLTDSDLACVQNLPNLESLNLMFTSVRDAGLVHLKAAAKLQHLYSLGPAPARQRFAPQTAGTGEPAGHPRATGGPAELEGDGFLTASGKSLLLAVAPPVANGGLFSAAQISRRSYQSALSPALRTDAGDEHAMAHHFKMDLPGDLVADRLQLGAVELDQAIADLAVEMIVAGVSVLVLVDGPAAPQAHLMKHARLDQLTQRAINGGPAELPPGNESLEVLHQLVGVEVVVMAEDLLDDQARAVPSAACRGFAEIGRSVPPAAA